MPGLLIPGALCPKCEDPIEAMIRTTNAAGVVAKYHHAKTHPKRRRARPCIVKMSREQDRELELQLLVQSERRVN